MAEFSSFFNSMAGDRLYSASKFAEYFASFLTDGVFNGGESLQVYANDSDYFLRVKVGKGWIQGYYYNLSDSEKILTPATAHATNPRIDRVVLKLDISQGVRSIQAVIKQGTPASEPEAPVLERDLTGSGIYELSLAQVLIPAGATIIPAANVTDERLDNNLCGLVNSLIQADTTNIFNQFQAFLNDTITDWDTWFTATQSAWNNWFGDTDLAWDNWFDDVKEDYEAWYAGIKSSIFDAVYFQFENWRYRAGHTYKILFDTPTTGDIKEEIRNTISNDLIASKVTEFDTPSIGQIQETLHVVEDNATVTKVTTFEVDGSITEVIS
ncbi:hypothetical protein BHU72_12040 [Desulfuribacillus stibiiarsenatis]|uniref:Uncharacterized protein n=1 Tax=Desulfuribacillus stibiiarsenatis TaxID=1390249 RepID=A0A1E5L875_9FIRM|nr:hypothetical protein [Desulfuribacillus stibiiarsenatis]OEH86258.1 hypothetical protein BHU72_12040 [Desulfuribacillus stibiiarsenatis]